MHACRMAAAEPYLNTRVCILLLRGVLISESSCSSAGLQTCVGHVGSADCHPKVMMMRMGYHFLVTVLLSIQCRVSHMVKLLPICMFMHF